MWLSISSEGSFVDLPKFLREAHGDLIARLQRGILPYLIALTIVGGKTNIRIDHARLFWESAAVLLIGLATRVGLNRVRERILLLRPEISYLAIGVATVLPSATVGVIQASALFFYGFASWPFVLTLMCNLACTSGATVTFTPSLKFLQLYLWTAWAPLFGVALWLGGDQGYTIALATVILYIFLLSQGRWLNQLYWQEFRRTRELNLADITLRQHREHLEELVAQRTKELEGKEAQLRLLLDSTAEAIYGVDLEGNCTFCNTACLRILGVPSKEELIGQPAHRFHPHSADGSSVPPENCRMCQVPVSGHGVHAEDEVLWRVDGSSFQAECWSYPQLQGEIAVGVVITFIDISLRKKQEIELQKLFQAVEQSKTTVVITDAAGTIEYLNPAFEKVTGYSREEAIGKNPRVLQSGVHPPSYFTNMWETLLRCDSYHGEICNKKKNGELFWESIGITTIKDAAGKITHFVAIKEDITLKKQLEEQLRYAQFMADNALALTKSCYWHRHIGDGDYYSTSGGTAAILGEAPAPDDRYRADQWYSRMLDADEAAARESAQRYFDAIEGRTDKFDATYAYKRPADGRIIWLHSGATVVRDEGGKATDVYGAIQNVTEQRLLEAELKKAKEAAEAANRAKSMFLANMSHEIRTPMNGILGFSRLMLRNTSATPQQKQYLETINQCGEHLLGLINDILEISRIEAGRTPLNRSTVDLHALLNDLDQMFRLRFDDAGLRFAVEHSPGLPRFANTDESKLRQVLINLIGNALKFTKEGGVALRLGSSSGTAGERWLEATVEDSGIGISADEIEFIFNCFEQTTSGRQIGKGTGLGLAISRNFAQLMGGDLTVQSQRGSGSTFYLLIPLELAKVESAPQPSRSRRVVSLKKDQPEVRVLIVDDIDVNRMLLADMLGPVGFSTREAADGIEALDINARWSPHLILMDAVMPVMSGDEAIRRVRAANGAEVKIITISASTFELDRNNALAAGADGFIAKPFHEAELFDQIASLLDIGYIYASDLDQPDSMTVRSGNPVIKIAGQLSEQMVSAIKLGDFECVTELIDQIATTDTDSAQILSRLAEQFDSESMLRIVEAAVLEN